MSIKTIGQQTQSNNKGLEKIINKGAERLVIDVLQSTQYSTPIPSTIRELVTNACDSQREKEIAVEILSGKAEIKDYFITRHGSEYEDSNFDSSYYQLGRLDPDTNTVRVEYIEDDEGTGYCDTVVIEDWGVGIGGRRLEGMLELGYSTKRNTSENFGAFGLGSKIALSTGVPYYTIETAHNGRLFKMNCHPYKTDFVITQWDADGHIILSNGDKAYYKNYDGYNYTKISFGSKKHNRRAYSNAVREQLSYINNVEFYTVYKGGLQYQEHFKKEVLINTDSCIVAQGSSWYAKPHIVIVKSPGDSVGINYGAIDFRELEMEDLNGNIGIKCPMRQSYIDDDGNEIVLQDGVDVTPSREKVIWNERTKEYVQGMLEKAAGEASDLIQEALKEDDFIKWIQLCTNILYKGNASETLSDDLVGLNHIARMVDTSKIRPMFKSSGLRFSGPKKMFTGWRVRHVHRVGNIVQRSELDDWSSADLSRVFITNAGASKITDLYLTMDDSRSFTLISPVGTDYLTDDILKETRPEIKQKLQAEKARYENNKQTIAMLLDKYTASVMNYDVIDIPESTVSTLESLDKKEATRQLTPKEFRELQNRTVGYTLRRKRRDETWTWDKVEPYVKTVVESTIPTFYGSKEDEDKLILAATLLENRLPNWGSVNSNIHGDWQSSPVLFREALPSNYWYQSYVSEIDKFDLGDAPQIIRLAKNNTKYAESNPYWKHIDDFFFTAEDDGSITVSEYLKPVLTAAYLSRRKETWAWLSRKLSKNLLTPAHDTYISLEPYMYAADRLRHIESDFTKYLLNFIDYQDICDLQDVSLRQEKSREFFVVDVPSIDAYDRDIAQLRQAFDDLSDEIGGFMYACAHDYHGSYDKHFKVILEAYNKFDIEVPEVEVPVLRYKLTPRS